MGRPSTAKEPTSTPTVDNTPNPLPQSNASLHGSCLPLPTKASPSDSKTHESYTAGKRPTSIGTLTPFRLIEIQQKSCAQLQQPILCLLTTQSELHGVWSAWLLEDREVEEHRLRSTQRARTVLDGADLLHQGTGIHCGCMVPVGMVAQALVGNIRHLAFLSGLHL